MELWNSSTLNDDPREAEKWSLAAQVEEETDTGHSWQGLRLSERTYILSK